MEGDQHTRPYLKIRDLSKTFGEFVALRDISLDVYEGEFVCFLGPSGCGKTTLLRAIAGLDIQTRGLIEQAGQDISTLPPDARDFGIVFQSYALFPNLRVARNIAYGLESRKLPKDQIQSRVKELLALVGLSDQGEKYPAQLSGGQQQRVALARALATSPGLLLLDEPLSALDAKVRTHLRSEITGLQKRLGVTTIMVTHDQEEALTMADRIVVMDHGVIVQIGTPQEIYSVPASSFVADFIGTMNFLQGTVGESGTIHIGQVTLKCDTAHIASGSSVTVAVRPEDIDAEGLSAGEDNNVEVEVLALEFLGSVYRAEIGGSAFGGSPMHAEFSSNLVRRKQLDVGSRIPVRLPPHLIRLFEVSAHG